MYLASILFKVMLYFSRKKTNNVEAAVMKIDAMPDFFVGDMCIINKLVGDMHQQTDGIANSGKQTGLVNKYMTSHEE